jgi:1,4-dihydroxy-2-naphthoate octaprenyltransferase
MLLKWLNSVHLPTVVVAFLSVIVGQLVINFNGAPVDLSTHQGQANFVTLFIGVLILALQKVTPTPTA